MFAGLVTGIFATLSLISNRNSRAQDRLERLSRPASLADLEDPKGKRERLQGVLDTAKGQFLFRVTAGGREFLLKEGTDLKYGARHLKRAIERHVVYPMANLLATEQIHLGDMLSIDWDQSQDHLAFTREAEGVLVPVKTLEPAVAVRAAQARRWGRRR